MTSTQVHGGAGAPLNVRQGREVFWKEYEEGVWEPDTLLVFERYLDSEHSYIDIGAWVGPTLFIGARLAKQAYGIEPDPLAYSELVENMQNNLPLTKNVALFNLCIATESGKKSFGNRGSGGDSMSSLLFGDEETSWTVDGKNFNEWVEENDVRDCNFIKMDIEGGEYSVLPTMSDYLRKNRPTVHLSLHPCFLGEQNVRGAIAWIRRSFLRLNETIQLLKSVSFYRYIYDPRGMIASSGIDTFRSRLRDRLARITWKPAVVLLTCLYSMLGGNDTLVLTDIKW